MSEQGWSLKAQVEWVSVGRVERFDWNAFPVLKASIVFADVARHELFSTSGTATSRIHSSTNEGAGNYVVDVLLPSNMATYIKSGTQFLVVRGSVCVGVGVIVDPGGPTAVA